MIPFSILLPNSTLALRCLFNVNLCCSLSLTLPPHARTQLVSLAFSSAGSYFERDSLYLLPLPNPHHNPPPPFYDCFPKFEYSNPNPSSFLFIVYNLDILSSYSIILYSLLLLVLLSFFVSCLLIVLLFSHSLRLAECPGMERLEWRFGVLAGDEKREYEC